MERGILIFMMFLYIETNPVRHLDCVQPVAKLWPWQRWRINAGRSSPD